MKKFLLIITLVFTFFITNINVNAEEFVFDASNTINNVNSLQNVISRAYEIIKDSTYKYYTILLIDNYYVRLYLFNDTSYNLTTNTFNEITVSHYINLRYTIKNDGTEDFGDFTNTSNYLQYLTFTSSENAYLLYDTNFNYKTNSKMSISGIYTDNIELNNGDSFPTIKQLLNYSSWNDYSYTTVDLNNYEYVILNLKDYTKTEPFDVSLQVKGMIGITPVYEFGTIEKSEITDRCNISYSDYTDYRLYVLENDIINNSVYYVKACEENSSFKFDSSIFDITYVTDDNVNDPVITVGGQEYNTIPFNKLTNSANKNEEENFIPGASEGFHPIESLVDYITSFWSSLTTFMSLVTKFFNTLPIEIRAVCITFFTTACTLGILKILKN